MLRTDWHPLGVSVCEGEEGGTLSKMQWYESSWRTEWQKSGVLWLWMLGITIWNSTLNSRPATSRPDLLPMSRIYGVCLRPGIFIHLDFWSQPSRSGQNKFWKEIGASQWVCLRVFLSIMFIFFLIKVDFGFFFLFFCFLALIILGVCEVGRIVERKALV